MLRQIAAYAALDNARLGRGPQLRPRRLLCGILALLLLPLPVAAGDLPNLTRLQEKGASVSGFVVDLDRGRIMAALAPDRPLTPASVTKLVTGALALESWGPAHSFTTRLAVTALPDAGVVEGDLVFVGGGDPALTEEGMWRLARDLAQAGVKRISGDLVIDASRFGQVACSTRDRCEALDQTRNAYAAPLSAAGVNFASVAVKLRPAADAGQPATILPDPFELPSFQVAGEAVTRGSGSVDLQVTRHRLEASERLVVQGGLPVDNGTLAVRRAVSHAERHTGELLLGFLQREGVAINGGLRFAYTPPSYAAVVAEYAGRPLADALRGMMYYSTNFTADVLALELARESGLAPPLQLPEAGQVLSRYLHDSLSLSRFAEGATPAARLRDGSGLDPDNRLSARELVALLDRVYMRMDLFQPFLGALSVPLHARGSLLRGQDPDWATNVAGKTGGLSVPVSVTTFAGYFRFDDGGWGALAFLVNGSEGRPIARDEAFEAMRRDFAILRGADRD